MMMLWYLQHFVYTIIWAFAQWLPFQSVQTKLQQNAWHHWEHQAHQQTRQQFKKKPDDYQCGRYHDQDHRKNHVNDIAISTVDVQLHKDNLLQYLQQTYGNDWRKRPLLLQGLWAKHELEYTFHENNDHTPSSNPNKKVPRKLSLQGLLKENLKIPYYEDATVKTLIPDGYGAVRDVVHNITLGKPHKIGTQLILEEYPHLINEIAPLDIVTELFGDYFSETHLQGSGPFNLFPGTTVASIFVAKNHKQSPGGASTRTSSSQETNTKIEDDLHTHKNTGRSPFTPLHCEPVANVAVQLSGQRKWTLISPQYSSQIKPSLAPSGRPYFASWANNFEHVPTYEVITRPGDAVWVPTWTWHKVEYIESEDIAIGGSLFHMGAFDFVQNNALFAALIIPAMMKEALGFTDKY